MTFLACEFLSQGSIISPDLLQELQSRQNRRSLPSILLLRPDGSLLVMTSCLSKPFSMNDNESGTGSGTISTASFPRHSLR